MRTLLTLLILGAVAAAEVEILGHELTVTIDPEKAAIESTDRVRVRGPGTISVNPPKGITVEPRSVEVAEGEHTIVFRFTGVVDNPVEKSTAATWVAGDRTAGTIGPKGSYLVRGFYVPSSRPAPFKTTVSVPLPQRAVVPGRRIAESEKNGMYSVTCETSYGLDGLVLVTGPWVVDEENIDGIPCRTYLLEQDRAHARILLSTLRAEIPRYQKLLGPVPDGRFDVVSNFFTTGYGFPNFTLLGEQVIRYVCAKTARSGATALPSGYLDHELVHCWLGNYLHVDYENGNWCEALTTWFANYGSSVREKRDVAYRKKVSRTFSLRVFGERDYPLRNFKSKRQDFENDIGYGKGSMVFHMLERDLGKQVLIDAVRKVVETKGGTALGWDAMVQALSEACGRDLAAWFQPWLDRPGAPILRIGSLNVKGKVVTGTVVQTQEGPAFPLRVPLVSHTGEELIIPVASKETVFRVEFSEEPQSVALDPDHHIFRRVRRDEVAPCLEAVMTADKKVGAGDPALLQRLGIDAGEPALPDDAAVFLVGVPKDLYAEVFGAARRQAPTFKVREGSFEFEGERYEGEDQGILMTVARRGAPPVAFFHGNGKPAFARTRYIPYYASHGWVVFSGGRPVARGEFPGDPGTRRRAGPGRVGSIETDLLRITEEQWLGRRAGTPAAYKLANELRGRLFRTGAKVLPWPGVSIVSGRVVEKPWIKTETLARTEIAEMYPMHWSADATKGRKFERVEIHPAQKVKGSLILLPENSTYELMQGYADNGAAALVVAAEDAEMKGRANQSAWLGLVPKAVRSKGRNPETLIASLIARSGEATLPVPVFYAAPSVAEAFKKELPEGEIGVALQRVTSSTSNLIGVFGPPKERGILLSAHWDGVGRIDGTIAQGASDNAAGTAVVLWVANQLKRDAEAGRLKKPVVIALFGAEEAGLLGSRQFASALKHPKCPIAKPIAMINVDAIAGGKDRSVYVIGRSKYPDLLAAIQPQLEKQNLELGRDIDKFAYRLGSDHWPLHVAGVPAVTLFGTDYRAMNTLADTLDKVDVEMLRDLAKAVYRTVRGMAE
ncbi:MAG: M28 family peptidase [Planctomycetota bacterium]|jgi:hypothetical protein